MDRVQSNVKLMWCGELRSSLFCFGILQVLHGPDTMANWTMRRFPRRYTDCSNLPIEVFEDLLRITIATDGSNSVTLTVSLGNHCPQISLSLPRIRLRPGRNPYFRRTFSCYISQWSSFHREVGLGMSKEAARNLRILAAADFGS